MTRHPSPQLFVSIRIIISALILLGLCSCSEQPAKFKLRFDHGPAGATTKYRLESHRVGMTYKNDELTEEFDNRLEGNFTYVVREILPGEIFVIEENNIWSWDEAKGDSGQIKRETKEYNYVTQINSRGRVIDFEIQEKSTPTRVNYIKNFFDQGMPVFPELEIAIGESWVQSAIAVKAEGDSVAVSTTYKVKGTARKNGYDCVIIEYNGLLILPIIPYDDAPDKTVGYDKIELSGIFYFAHREGKNIHNEEKRRFTAIRDYVKDDEQIHRVTEFDAVLSQSLVE